MIGYFSKHQSLRNSNMLKNIKIGSFLVLLSNCDWQFETNWVDLTCRMMMIGILLRPNYILKDGYQQGIFVRKVELAIDEKDDEKPDLKVEYLRNYFSKEIRHEAEKDLCQEKMVELCESLFDSNEIEEYCLEKGCIKNELCYFVVAKMSKLYNIDMLGKMLGNATVFE